MYTSTQLIFGICYIDKFYTLVYCIKQYMIYVITKNIASSAALLIYFLLGTQFVLASAGTNNILFKLVIYIYIWG